MHWTALCREARLFVLKATINPVLLLMACFQATTTKMKYLGHRKKWRILRCVLLIVSDVWLACKLIWSGKITVGGQHNVAPGAQVVSFIKGELSTSSVELLIIIDVEPQGQVWFICSFCCQFFLSKKPLKLWFRFWLVQKKLLPMSCEMKGLQKNASLHLCVGPGRV